ncbi:hypothetical protein REPUB_Repub20aG0096600 [Reevesia pubescens]
MFFNVSTTTIFACWLWDSIQKLSLVSFPEVPSKAAFNDIEDCLMFRYLMPVSLWKLQRWLQIGEEKRLSKALKIADNFLYDCISSKREKLRSRNKVEEDEFDLLTALLVEEKGESLSVSFKISDKFLRDTAFNFMAAGKDTISACMSWFFWLIAKKSIGGNIKL